MNQKLFWTFVIGSFALFVPGRSQAQFDASPFYVQQLRMRPEFFRDGTDSEDLKFKDSLLQFNFKWEEARAAISFGSADQNAKAIWFTPRPSSPDWQVLEASVGYKTGFGEFRLGKMPIRMVFEDFQNSDFEFLPDSALRQSNWFVRTDSGLRYFVAKYPWQTALYGHVGEDDGNLDRRYFATTYLKFQPSQGFGFVASGFVGRTGVESTLNSPAASYHFQWNPNQSARIRAATLDVFYLHPAASVLVEQGVGQILQEQASQFGYRRADVILSLFNPVYFFGRYESLNPNMASGNFEINKYQGGVGYSIQKGLGKISVTAGSNEVYANFEFNYLREREGDQ